MKILRECSEQEMIWTFLKGEIDSPRFGDKVKYFLDALKLNRSIIDYPNLDDPSENDARKELLGEFRGLGKNKLLFENFPTDVSWKQVVLTKDDLQKVKFINWSYWIQISGGTRLAKDAAQNVNRGVEISGVSNKQYYDALDALKKGKKFVEPIFATIPGSEDLVLVEGHLRITTYLLDPQYTPHEIEAILGYSENFRKWDLY